jgi:hypothetical protein
MARAAEITKLAARILGFLAIVYLLLSLFSMLLSGSNTFYTILTAALALAGYILSWWHKFIGGLLLILLSIALSIRILMDEQNNLWRATDWLILGLPFLVTGALFIISGYLNRKTSS